MGSKEGLFILHVLEPFHPHFFSSKTSTIYQSLPPPKLNRFQPACLWAALFSVQDAVKQMLRTMSSIRHIHFKLSLIEYPMSDAAAQRRCVQKASSESNVSPTDLEIWL